MDTFDPPPAQDGAPLASPSAADAEPDLMQAAEQLPAAAPDMLSEAQRRLVERRHPLRFIWHIDGRGAFSIEPGDFTTLVGAPTQAVLGRNWEEIARTLALDPEGHVLRATTSRDTFSSIAVEWPAESTSERLPVVLSGLPVLDRDRTFHGYRGFGVCRDVARIGAVIAARRGEAAPPPVPAVPPVPAPPTPPPQEAEAADATRENEPEPRRRLTVVPAAKNVVPLRAGIPSDKRPALTAVEHSAFQEIARALGAGIGTNEPAPAQPEAPVEKFVPYEVEAGRPPSPASDMAAATDALAAALKAQLAVAEMEAQPGSTRADAPLPADALQRSMLDRLPIALLAYRDNDLLFANAAFFEWTGYCDLAALTAAGGVAALFGDAPADGSSAVGIRTAGAHTLAVDVRLLTLAAEGKPALMLMLTRHA